MPHVEGLMIEFLNPSLSVIFFKGAAHEVIISTMTRPDKDDVERLSRGMPTRANIGHRLTQKERILFEAAQKQGFLKLPVTRIRPNVLNVYRLWCKAQGCECIVKGGPE
jgi:hypothetical protein